jgi:hypothetical protein
MRYTVPHLEALRVKVTYFFYSWLDTQPQIWQDLLDRVAAAGLLENTVYMLDLLGNSSVRFKQEDDCSRSV